MSVLNYPFLAVKSRVCLVQSPTSKIQRHLGPADTGQWTLDIGLLISRGLFLLEELDGAFVLLGCFASGERAEIPALARLRIFLP